MIVGTHFVWIFIYNKNIYKFPFSVFLLYLYYNFSFVIKLNNCSCILHTKLSKNDAYIFETFDNVDLNIDCWIEYLILISIFSQSRDEWSWQTDRRTTKWFYSGFFSFWGQSWRRKWGTECLHTRFALPTLLCAGYCVKLINLFWFFIFSFKETLKIKKINKK